ncbi:MAG: carboxypeptidase-like regulatory domain-containing protein [Candidatus Methanoperedens sp.]|nr:carboxypeptidase-like regulatory domain-containing protein [Candidatus Methanoperedens sp.]
MKILENITSGYKKAATGIAIVSVLALMYIALIPGSSLAYVYGPDGGLLAGAFVFIKEWPQYNDTTDIGGSYAINEMPIGEYTLVAMGNDSYAPNVTSINVTEGNTNFHDIQLKSANHFFLPFLYKTTGSVYDSKVQLMNNGTSNASVELTYYFLNGTVAGNDVYMVQPGKLWNKDVYEITGATGSLFVGSAIVKSELPIKSGGYIKTIQKDVYSLASSFSDSDIGTNVTIPFLYNGGNYDSGLQVINPGNTTATVTVKLYYINGTQAATTTYTLDPKKLGPTTITSLLPGVFFIGSSTVTSNLPIAAQGYIRTSASGIYSIAPALSNTVTTAYIPFVYNGNYYDSGLQVFNPGNVPAQITVSLYYVNGTKAANTTYILPPKNLVGTTVSSLIPGVLFVGSSEIISNQSVVAQGYIRTSASNVYSVAPQVRKPGSIGDVNVPFLYNTASHNSGIQAVNPNSAAASVNVRYYYTNGTQAGSYSGTVGPYGLAGVTVSSVVPGDFTGYSVVSANQSIVAQGYIRQATDNIYSIAPPVEK